MRTSLRRRIRTFLSVSFGVSLLASLGVSTYAWFSTNMKANASYRSVVAYDSNIVKTVEYYAIASTGTSGEDTTYTFTDLSTDYSLGSYDPLGINGTSEHGLLIVITLKQAMSNVSLSAGADSDILNGGNSWGTVACDEDGVAWNDTSKFPLSSIVTFHYYSPSEISGTYTATGEGDTWSFVTIGSDSNPSFEQNSTLATESSSTDKLYLMLDYNIDAIDSIYSYNIGNEHFSGEVGSSSSGVTFNCDFTVRVSANS